MSADPAKSLNILRLIHSDRSKSIIDKMAYTVGVVGNLAVVPQIVRAWESDAPGLAVSTWIVFTFISLIWLIYAIQHKQKPLILAQSVGITCNILVVTGWMINNL